MYIYVVPYFFILMCGWIVAKGRLDLLAARSLFIFAIFPAFLIVIFRGGIGTDTYAYEVLIEKALNGNCSVEIGFCLLAKFISFFTEQADINLRIITFVFCALFYIAFSFRQQDIVVGCLLIFPVFFYDMSMNGIRYGISFILFKIIYDNFSKQSFLYIPIYFLMHTSSLILYLFYRLKELKISYIIFACFLLIPVFLIGQSYFLIKYYAYMEYQSPNFYSGVFDVCFIFVLILLLRKYFHITRTEFLLLIFLLSSFYVLSNFSYAGLRFIGVLFYYVSIRLVYSLCSTQLSDLSATKVFFVLSLVGGLYFVKLLRSMIMSNDYFPYVSIFQF